MLHMVFYCTKFSSKQSTTVICWFGGLRTAYRKRQKAICALESLSTAKVFDYIICRVKPGLNSCEDLAMAMDNSLNNN